MLSAYLAPSELKTSIVNRGRTDQNRTKYNKMKYSKMNRAIGDDDATARDGFGRSFDVHSGSPWSCNSLLETIGDDNVVIGLADHDESASDTDAVELESNGVHHDDCDLVRPGTSFVRTFEQAGREVHVGVSALKSFQYSLGVTELNVISNLLGRYPHQDGAQIARISADVCQSLVSDDDTPMAIGAYGWDTSYHSPSESYAKFCLQLEENVPVVRIGDVPMVQRTVTGYVTVIIPVLSEGSERMSIWFGNAHMTPPVDPRYSHFGFTLPSKYLRYVGFQCTNIDKPFFYVSTHSWSGIARTVGTTGTVVTTGLECRLRRDFLNGAMILSITPEKSGTNVLRCAGVTFLSIGCLQMSFSRRRNVVVTLPRMQSQVPVLLAVLFDSQLVSENASAGSQKSVCMHKIGEESRAVFSRIL